MNSLAEPFIGTYRFEEGESGSLLDFGEVTLHPDGTYDARVEAVLLNPQVRSFGSRCMLPEEGQWNVYHVTGTTRIRVRPTTSRARVYTARIDEHGRLTMARRGIATTLLSAAAPSRRSGIISLGGSASEIAV